ncbi:hypothetical protein ALC56_13490, partial [Trachymyrmex septentrionalis]
KEKWYVRVLGTQSIGCFRFEPCSTIEGMLECERRRKSTEEKG